MNILHIVWVFAFLVFFGISGFTEGRSRNTGEAGLWLCAGILVSGLFFWYTPASPNRHIEFAVLPAAACWASGFIEGRLRTVVSAGTLFTIALAVAEYKLVSW